ncbi:tetratricopeptide repeat protein [Candidatus Dependentiae bacterium]
MKIRTILLTLVYLSANRSNGFVNPKLSYSKNLQIKQSKHPTEMNLTTKSPISNIIFSQDSFFHEKDESAEKYELYLKAIYQNTSGDRGAVEDTSSSLMSMAPHAAAYDVRTKYLFETGQFSKLIKLPIFSSDDWKKLNWETILLGSRAMEAAGKTKRSDAMFDYLREKHPDRDQIVYFDSVRLLKRGNRDKALERIDSFLEGATLKARHAIFYQLKASVFMKPPKVELKKALSMINKSLELNPRNPKTWLSKAALHDRLGQDDKAINALRSLLNTTDNPSFRKILVERLFKKSQFKKAAEELEKINEETPEHYFDLALLMWKAEDFKNAEKNINKSLSLNKNFRKARFLKLEILLAQDKKNKILEMLKTWISEEPTNPIVLKALLSLIGHGFSPKEILPILENTFKNNPENTMVVSAFADLSLAAGRDKQALSTYRKLMKLISGDTELESKTLHQIGFLQYRLGDAKSAVQNLEKSVKHTPTSPASNNLLAYLYAERGNNLEKALELVNMALSKNPLSSAFLDTKGLILMKLNRYGDSLTVLRKALKLDPLNTTVKDRINNIKSLMLKSK